MKKVIAFLAAMAATVALAGNGSVGNAVVKGTGGPTRASLFR
jgi:ABC-type hemin transport system substrate-binding protein